MVENISMEVVSQKPWIEVSGADLDRAHIVIFAALLILAASVLFLVQHPGAKVSAITASEVSAETDSLSDEEVNHFVLYALWSASISLCSAIFGMTLVALLNRPLDKPKTLLINSRWIRLAPRLPAVALIICLPLIPNLDAGIWCGAATSTLYVVFLWEWIAGLEKNWKLIEPKEAGD
jgi:hypothetical protein